jgi:spermidine/putrescine transport system substrate-binding protein
MHDSGEQTEKMLEMWSRVKGDNLSTGMLIGIILFFGTLIILGIWRKIDKYRKAQRRIKRRHHFHKLQKKVTNTQN